MNMNLNNLEVARQKIMVTDDPTIISNKTGGIIGTHHIGKYYICIHGGFRLEMKSFSQLLGIYPMMHYPISGKYSTAEKFAFFASCWNSEYFFS